MECLKKNEIHQNLCEEGMNVMLTNFVKYINIINL